MLNKYFTLLLLVLIGLSSCKKDPDKIPSPEKPPVSNNRTTDEKVRDSIYFYYKYLSYWESSIPVYNPISDISDKYTSGESLLNHLMGLTPVKNDYVFHGPGQNIVENYTGPLDRFSWIEDISSNSGRSARADTYDGFGLFVVFEGGDANSAAYVGLSEGNSPADKAGIKRGDKIIKINGVEALGKNFRLIEAELNKTQLVLDLERAGVPFTKTLTYGSYDIFPVVKDSVYSVNADKVGYFALSSFEEMTNDAGQYTAMYNAMNAAFNKFNQQAINKIIIDLRYNTGGYVSTAIYLANKIVNSNGAGKLMFSYDINKNLKEEKAKGSREFDDVMFNNSASKITDIYFLVSDYTASASEIVISALKPYANVRLIGEHGSTYGKPVGFFRQDILKKAGLWAASFKIVNSAGYTDYWDGIPADKPGVFDNVRYDFGDLREDMLATAIQHIKTGSYTLSGSSAKASSRTVTTKSSSAVPVNKLRERNMIKD